MLKDRSEVKVESQSKHGASIEFESVFMKEIT